MKQNVNMGANKIKWTNDITLEEDHMSFCPKIIFSYKWIFLKNCYFLNKCL
jgi:hypothetical protein